MPDLRSMGCFLRFGDWKLRDWRQSRRRRLQQLLPKCLMIAWRTWLNLLLRRRRWQEYVCVRYSFTTHCSWCFPTEYGYLGWYCGTLDRGCSNWGFHVHCILIHACNKAHTKCQYYVTSSWRFITASASLAPVVKITYLGVLLQSEMMAEAALSKFKSEVQSSQVFLF